MSNEKFEKMLDKLNMWIGCWYIVFWSSKNLELEIGVGENYTNGNYGPFFSIPKTWGSFYFVISKPTLRYIQENEQVSKEYESENRR